MVLKHFLSKTRMVIVVLVFHLLLFSCKQTIHLDFQKTYCCQLDSIHLKKEYIRSFQITKIEDEAGVLYLDMADSTLNWHTITEPEQKQTYSMKKVLGRNLLESGSQWTMINSDSIWALNLKNKLVYLLNTQDEIIDSFPTHGKEDDLYYVTFASKKNDMKFSYPYLLVPANAMTVFEDSIQQYFALAGVLIDVRDKSLQLFGRYSDEELLSPNAFVKPYDEMMIKGHRVVFSSEEDPYLYEYDIQKRIYKKHLCQSAYIDSMPPYRGDRFDRLAKVKYTIESPRYEMIQYDNYNHSFYRIIKHRTIIPKAEGLYKPKEPVYEYSLMVLDSTLSLQDEILLPKANAGNFILPFSKGFFLASDSLSLRQTGYLCLDYFTIKR